MWWVKLLSMLGFVYVEQYDSGEWLIFKSSLFTIRVHDTKHRIKIERS